MTDKAVKQVTNLGCARGQVITRRWVEVLEIECNQQERFQLAQRTIGDREVMKKLALPCATLPFRNIGGD